MRIKREIIAASAILIMVIAALVALYVYPYSRVDMSVIEYIEQLQRGPNEFSDLAGDINVESVDDIGFIVNGDYNINIHYGDQIIEMNKNCFESAEYISALGRIGIKVFTHVNDDGTILYKVTYWDEEVDEYSLVN